MGVLRSASPLISTERLFLVLSHRRGRDRRLPLLSDKRSGLSSRSGIKSGIGVANIGGDNLFTTMPESGTQVIASVSATPEPATSVLWLTGIGLMIVTRKRVAQRPRVGYVEDARQQ